jgi:hypothetical protein
LAQKKQGQRRENVYDLDWRQRVKRSRNAV